MKNPTHFTKMQSLGNDFVIINNLSKQLDLSDLPIARLGNRHTGIGFDQLLVIEPDTKAHVICHIMNADGSPAMQCGNGLRCVARYLHEEHIFDQSSLTLATQAGVFPVIIKDYDHICVNMGSPTVLEKTVSFELPRKKSITLSILSVGNLHAVMKVDTLEPELIDETGLTLSTHPYFQQGVNVGFMQVIHRSHIRLQTYERGAGKTLACGSNACAAAALGMINGWLDPLIQVEFEYGSLTIEWDGSRDHPIYMTGPAERVFEGRLV